MMLAQSSTTECSNAHFEGSTTDLRTVQDRSAAWQSVYNDMRAFFHRTGEIMWRLLGDILNGRLEINWRVSTDRMERFFALSDDTGALCDL